MPKEIYFNHLREIKAFLETHHLWNQPLLIAVSGGMDSVYLVQMLLQLKQNISLAHINYQLRGKDSELDEQFVRTLAQEHKISVFVKKINLPKLLDNGGNMQMLARSVRYDYFEELTAENAFKGTLTAHHRKDQVETILRNLVHGAGLNGLIGMPIVNKNIYRPILNIAEREIKSVMLQKDWKWREDVTNKEVNYDRNYIRHEVIPSLEQINVNAEERIMHTASLLNEAQWIVQHYTTSFLKTNLHKAKEGTYTIKKSVLTDHPAIQTIVYGMTKQLSLNESIIPEIIKLLDSHVGASIPLVDFVIWNDRENLVFIKNTNHTAIVTYEIIESSVQTLSVVHFMNLSISFELVKTPLFEKSKNKEQTTYFINASAIEWPLKLRTWREGDRMQPFGMKGYKKVSRIFIDEKIPNHEKSSQVLIEDQKGILGILGIKMAERTRVFGHSSNVLKINFSTKVISD